MNDLKNLINSMVVEPIKNRGKNIRDEMPCKVCRKPMLVAPGQIAYYHKACRKFRHNKK